MLYTCRRCGEVWGDSYIAKRREVFHVVYPAYSDPYITSCPGCVTETLPGIPGTTTREDFAVSRVIRVCDSEYIVLHGLSREPQRRHTLHGAVAEALCRG